MKILKQAIVVLAAIVLGAAGPAGSDSDPESYEIRLPLTLSGNAPVQRVEVPTQILVTLQNADMADLRVFDGRGRVAPMAQLPAVPASTRRTTFPAMPILGSRDALEVTGVSLKLDDQGRAHVASVDGNIAGSGSGVSVLGALFDTRGAGGAAERLELDAVVPDGQPVTFVVEASEDLQDWRVLGDLVVYHGPNDAVRGGKSVTLEGTMLRDTRLRVTWRAQSRLLSPVTVRSAVLITRPAGATALATVDATAPALTDAHTLDFAVPFATQIAAIVVNPAAGEGLVPVRILGRNHSEEPWSILSQSAAEPTGTTINLTRRSVRAIRIEADRRTAGFRAAPAIRLGFLPRQIAFVATGRPPFTLAAGRADAGDVFLPFATVRRGSTSKLPEATVRGNEVFQLALRPVSDGSASQRRLVLWGVLLATTALLGTIAWLLWKRSRV